MKVFRLEPFKTAPAHSCGQLATILAAATRTDHPLAGLVALHILAPGSADAIPFAEVGGIDLREGMVAVPAGNTRNDVMFGNTAMDVVEEFVDCRTVGTLIADAHGDPIRPDVDASDLAVELLSDVCPDTARIAWDLRSIRQASFLRLREAGVSRDLLAWTSGIMPLPYDEAARYRATTGQLRVANFWAFRLMTELTLAGRRRLTGAPDDGTLPDLSFGRWLMDGAW